LCKLLDLLARIFTYLFSKPASNYQTRLLFYCISKQSSGVKISGVSYEHIKGTSASPVAIKFDCSESNPCWGLKLQDIKLNYPKGSEISSCRNARGSTNGVVIPTSCL
jgi:hypothetical protein